MSIAVRKTVSLPPEIALEVERQARAQGKTLSAVIQDALREARSRRLRKQLGGIQDYWSRQAREQGVLSEEDLDRILGS